MSETRPVKIQVRGLSKVFGNQPKKALELRTYAEKLSESLVLPMDAMDAADWQPEWLQGRTPASAE